LPATSRELKELREATGRARRARELVAGQVAELVVEADRMGGRSEVSTRIIQVVEAEGRIGRAAGRLAQAQTEGMALSPALRAAEEGRASLRAAAMALAVAAAGWAAAIDLEDEVRRNGNGNQREEQR
jgi:hypothetical protein